MLYLSATGIIGPGMKEIERSFKMKKFRLLSLLILISAALLFSASAFGAGKNTFKYTESYKDKIVKGSYWAYTLGKYTINVKINLEDGDIDKFNSATCFDVTINPDGEYDNGTYSRSACLGDPESSYQEGDTRASMVFMSGGYDLPYDIAYRWVNLKWNKKKLTIMIKGQNGLTDLGSPLLASDYYWYYDAGTYDESYKATVSVYNGTDDPFIDKTFDIDVRAKVKVKDNRDYGALYQATVKGKGYNY
jgi:hypothetical protein